jgi:hypothetical protein
MLTVNVPAGKLRVCPLVKFLDAEQRSELSAPARYAERLDRVPGRYGKTPWNLEDRMQNYVREPAVANGSKCDRP